MRKIFIGADHRGFDLKNKLVEYLNTSVDIEDVGSFSYNPDDDYPDIAFEVAQKVVAHDAIGILICGSSYGVCVAANKVKGIIATNPDSPIKAAEDRQHHGGNLLCLASDELSNEEAIQIINTWLNTEFDGGRHQRRIEKIKNYESSN